MKSNSNYKIIDSYNYFEDKLIQMEHESKAWLSGISVDILGEEFIRRKTHKKPTFHL